MTDMKFSTKALHVGQQPDASTGAIVPPIYLTSTYVQSSPGISKGYDYTRAGNPNFTNLEKTLAALEDGRYATVFSSGLGAITAITSTLRAGDEVVAINDLYGGTYRLFKQVFEKFRVRFRQLDFNHLRVVGAALARHPALLLLESPTNPLLKIIDIQAIAAMCRLHGVTSIVDNTFASPYFQQPLNLGADLVLHSSTKYLGGHSDLIGGVAATNDKALKEKMDFARKALGLNPSPFDAWLLSRSLKTLAVRMERHQENAFAVAEFLSRHPRVKSVSYPGLRTHRNHEIARKQMSGFSGIVSAEFRLSLSQTKRLISSFKVFSLAESLGGVEALVDHPASMTHASIPKKEREAAGLSDGLVRFSVGIEDKRDLVQDLEAALRRIR
ncbi:MAG: PLP-dependent aspartate aminotransferase family protein [Terriglobales bacterium]|jgi:cystathionine beta-lyase/cystathionine gamma-synthase